MLFTIIHDVLGWGFAIIWNDSILLDAYPHQNT